MADSYIEVHHIKQLSDGEHHINPANDLLPVCSNCHQMLHRKRKGNISITNLRKNRNVSYYRNNLKINYEQDK